MRKMLLLAALVVGVAGCPSVDELFLTPSEAAALTDNFEATVDFQQQVSEFVFAAGRGELDLASEFSNYNYDPPSAANAFRGTLTILGGDFPFGSGDLTVHFTASGDAGPVDPYVVDLSGDTQVTIDGDYDFSGLSSLGETLTSTADFTMTTVQNGAQVVSTLVDGTFVIDLAGYAADLTANGLELTLDLLTRRVTNVLGELRGKVDIPNFVLDANFTLTGLGSDLQIAIDAAATTISYTLNLFSL